MNFNKLPKTFEEQLDLLIARGLIVPDRDKALHYLQQLNYYRLAAYWLPFEVNRNPHRFFSNVYFDQILGLYCFDRELRLHLLDAIERIEISIRTQLAYYLSHHCGPHGYLSKAIYKNSRFFDFNMTALKEQVERSDELFIQHYKKNYQEELPPIWVSCEIMSLGLLSRFYSNLKLYDVRRKIAAVYLMDESFLEGVLEHISYLRNICAHHSRLWNRHLTKKMPFPKNKPPGLRINMNIKAEHKLYNSLVIIQHFIKIISPDSHWSNKLMSLIENDEIKVNEMGFPEHWKSLPVWQNEVK